MNSFNPMQMMQMLKGGNLQQMTNMLLSQNPQIAQLLQGVNVNDSKAMEQLCRNVCAQKGIDFNTMLAQFKQQNNMR